MAHTRLTPTHARFILQGFKNKIQRIDPNLVCIQNKAGQNCIASNLHPRLTFHLSAHINLLPLKAALN